MLTHSPAAAPGARAASLDWAVLALVAAALGTAGWLVPASARVVGWSAGTPQRVALIAPLSRLWMCLVAASAAVGVASWLARRRGVLPQLAGAAAPLLLLLLWTAPYLPWPSHAPFLMIFSGPLRWAVAALAIAASASRVVGRTWRTRLPALSTAGVFVLSAIVYASFGVRFLSEPGLGGDQPHYLVITHSLLVDRDLDISNNHERRDYRGFFGGTLRPDYLQRGRRGEIYSVHAPGLPALLLPAYAVAGATGAIVFLGLIGALAAVAVFALAADVAGRWVATIVWAGVCLTVPFVPHAWLVYPELPGALIVAWSALWIWRGDGSTRRMLLHGAMLAALPWLHTKFIVLLAALAVVAAIRLWPRKGDLALFFAPIVVGTAGWLASFYWMYGTFDPQSAYGAFASVNVATSNVPHGTLGLLFDQKFGLLVYSPIYVLAAVGIAAMLRDWQTRWFAAALTTAAAAFLVATTRFYMWWGGSSAPARFLVPIVPLAAPAIAVAVARLRGAFGRAAAATLLIASLAIAVASVLSPHAAYLFNDPHGRSALVRAVEGGAPLDEWLPTFTEEQWRPAATLLMYWLAALATAAAATAVAVRRRLARSAPAVATVAVFVLTAAAAALPGRRPIVDREAFAARGQLALLREYDASRLRAIDIGWPRRLSEGDAFAALTLSITGPGDFVDLPAGEYEARVWRDGGGLRGDIRAELPGGVILARMDGASAGPGVLRFTLPVSAPVRVSAAGATPQRTEIAPLALPAGDAKSDLQATAIDPVDGPPGSYLAYVDRHSYPEGGVYWTRGTEASRVILVATGGREAQLVLHVGPNAGPVLVAAGARQFRLEMAAGETRTVSVPLGAGEPSLGITVRAARAFRPAASDPASDDQRSLGCQVRPLVR